MNLGEKIKYAREAAGLTQQDLGVICRTTKQTIYKYETGIVTNIPLDRLEKIASALGVSSAYLMGWEEKKEIPDELTLTEGEESMLKLFRQIPEDQQPMVLNMIKAALRGK